MKPVDIIALVNVVACAILVVASKILLHLVKTAASKRVAHLTLVFVMDGIFLGIAIAFVAVGLSPIILFVVIPFTVLITTLNLRRLRFCPSCAQKVMSICALHKPPEFCRFCGTNLAPGG
jgi:hypothetical protein